MLALFVTRQRQVRPDGFAVRRLGQFQRDDERLLVFVGRLRAVAPQSDLAGVNVVSS